MEVFLERAVGRTFAKGSDTVDPALRGFVRDLVAPYGLALREDLLDPPVGGSYGEMAEVLVRATVDAQAPVDLLILAHAMPDVVPGRSTATYLSGLCPGDPLAFAICDQGTAAAFTACAVAAEYLRSPGFGRALVLMLEQSALHHVPTSADVSIPGGHAAVALLLGGPGPRRVSRPTQHTDVAPDQVGALLSAYLENAPTGMTAILGAPLAAGVPPPREPFVVAPADQPFTGVWSELATRDAAVVADYDPALRYLCLLTVS